MIKVLETRKKIKSLQVTRCLVTLLAPLTSWACKWRPLYHGTLACGTSGPIIMLLNKYAER